MKILVASNGYVIAHAAGFLFGAWEEKDIIDGVVAHKWKAMDDERNILGFYIDSNKLALDGNDEPAFQVFEVEAFPDDYVSGKYLFIDDEFVENPDYVEPEPTPEEKIAVQEAKIAELEEVVTLLIDDIIPSIMMGSV